MSVAHNVVVEPVFKLGLLSTAVFSFFVVLVLTTAADIAMVSSADRTGGVEHFHA